MNDAPIRTGPAVGGVTAADALARVGLTVRQVTDAAGDALAAGPAYLVGSLAAGLGNAASDVDLHVIQQDLLDTVGPHMFFVNEVTVDVQSYPASWVEGTRELAGMTPVVETGVGPVALEAALGPRACMRVSRWLQALPLTDGVPPVFEDDEARRILPLLVRESFDRLLLAAALARLADSGHVGPGPAREYLWRQASRWLLDLCCRAAGDVTVNHKWLTSRALRLGLPVSGGDVDERSLRRSVERCGLPEVDEWQVTSLQPAEGARVVSLGRSRRLVTRHDRVLDSWCDEEGPTGDIVSRIGAARAFEAVRRGELDLVVDGSRTRRVLEA